MVEWERGGLGDEGEWVAVGRLKQAFIHKG